MADATGPTKSGGGANATGSARFGSDCGGAGLEWGGVGGVEAGLNEVRVIGAEARVGVKLRKVETESGATQGAETKAREGKKVGTKAEVRLGTR
ncbi:hypothetical protein [Actinokineospora iranica]|uniref:hypothetical protein n=1 Tax=Actinokineospora iranica TaxID=1271860 RepID=UPI001113E98C|nr:hypothetical protein [Actinokineospora iranica]